LKAHLNLLRRAKRGKLPAKLDGADAAVLLELKRLGYMDAIDTTTLDGPAVMDPVITVPGAQYLKEQSTITVWARGAIGAVILAILIAAALKLLNLE
jgi:hypothetical protein